MPPPLLSTWQYVAVYYLFLISAVASIQSQITDNGEWKITKYMALKKTVKYM